MQVIVDDLLINYQIIGKGAVRLIILHGWGQNLNSWINFSKILSKHNFQILILDLPGFGASSNPKDGWNSYNYAKLITKFLNKIKYTPDVIIGHSFGGKIASLIASQKLILFKKLILISPSLKNFQSIITKLKIKISKLVKIFISKDSALGRYLLNKTRSADYLNFTNMQNIFKNIINEDVTHEARKINCETVMIWGENDQEISLKNGKTLEKYFKKIDFRVMWASDHSPQICNPKQLASLFLETI